jgi:23S rRNA pseudouridine2457 synthase
MTAAIGHPTLRLIRVRIKNIQIGKLKPGEVRKLTKTEIDLLTS